MKQSGMPFVKPLAPGDQSVHLYDQQHFLTYARLLTAEREGISWHKGAAAILGCDVAGDAHRAHRCWDSHLARAHWIATTAWAQIWLEHLSKETPPSSLLIEPSPRSLGDERPPDREASRLLRGKAVSWSVGRQRGGSAIQAVQYAASVVPRLGALKAEPRCSQTGRTCKRGSPAKGRSRSSN